MCAEVVRVLPIVRCGIVAVGRTVDDASGGIAQEDDPVRGHGALFHGIVPAIITKIWYTTFI